MILRNKITGVEGEFVREFTNYYGESIEVKTLSSRNYYALKHEWEEIQPMIHNVIIDGKNGNILKSEYKKREV